MSNSNLIPIREENGDQLVSGRELHTFIESKRKFTDWIKYKIKNFGFVENKDFTIHKFVIGKNAMFDYVLTLDTAKELAMLEGNNKGKQARHYFIEYEKKHKLNTEQLSQMVSSMAQIADGVASVAKSQEVLINLTTNHSERLERLEKQQFTDKPVKSISFTPEVIDARAQEYDFAKINGRNVRRIILNERVNYSINDILQAIGVTTNSGQVAKKLYKNAPHTVVKIHIFGNTHPAWFCTKKGIDLIKSGSRKLNGRKLKCELN